MATLGYLPAYTLFLDLSDVFSRLSVSPEERIKCGGMAKLNITESRYGLSPVLND